MELKPTLVRTATNKRRKRAVQGSRSLSNAASLADRVEDITRRFRLGQFGAALFRDAEQLLHATLTKDPRTDAVLLEARCVCAEILDLQGNVAAAQSAVQEAEEIHHELRPTGSYDTAKISELRLLRERIRFSADYARFHLYRQGRFGAASALLASCAVFIESKLRRLSFPCYGSMGLIKYFEGCSARQQGRLDDADRFYGDAIEQYRARLSWSLSKSDRSREQEIALASHNTAVILGLGLGWTNSQRGFLSRAIDTNIVPAQMLMVNSQDQTHHSYLALLHGSTIRSLKGSSDHQALMEARKSIENALRGFTTDPYNHQPYAVRAEYELSLCCLTAGDFDGARNWIQRMDDRARSIRSTRWEANAWIVRSRITSRERGSAQEALKQSERALALLHGDEELLGVIDARLARAEALIGLNQRSEARNDLGKALEIVGAQQNRNRKIESVVHILMARSHLHDGNTLQAEQAVAAWSQIKEGVEHATVHEMGAKVVRMLDTLRFDFAIPWRTTDLRHAVHDRRLRAWLIYRATSGSGAGRTKADIAKELGIGRTTLNYWEDEVRQELQVLKTRDTTDNLVP